MAIRKQHFILQRDERLPRRSLQGARGQSKRTRESQQVKKTFFVVENAIPIACTIHVISIPRFTIPKSSFDAWVLIFMILFIFSVLEMIRKNL